MCFISEHKISTDHEDIKIIFTTDTLINSNSERDIFHIDCTYRILGMGFPVIVTRTSDFNKKFHISFIGVLKRDDKNSLKWFLTKYIELCSRQNEIFSPTTLVSDCDQSIIGSFNDIFPGRGV